MKKIIFALLMALGFVFNVDVIAAKKSNKIIEVPSIEIKGFSIGMPEDDAKALIDKIGGIVIAETHSEYYNLAYNNGKLDKLIFLFKVDRFEYVLDALKGKYPELKCSTGKASNAMGATYEQVRCMLFSENAVLSLDKRIDINTSSLVIDSKRLLEESISNKEKSKSDI